MSGKAGGKAPAAPGNSRRKAANRAPTPADNPAQYEAFIETVRQLELGGSENDRAFFDAVEQVLPPRLGRRRARRCSGA